MCRPCSTMSSPTLTIAVMSLGGHDAHEPGEHPGGPDAAAQGHQHAASIGAPGRAALPAAPGTIAARHASAHPLGSARDRGVGPAGGGTGQRRRRGLRRARRPGRRAARLTFAEWDRAADGVAGHLARRGVAKGDVVCLLLPSCIDYAVLYAALLRLGAITSGINPRMGAGEVASIVERAAPVLLVVDPEAAPLPDAGTVDGGRAAPRSRAWWAGEPPDALARAGARRPGGGGLDQRDDGPAQGRRLRPRQPGRGGPGHRRAEPARATAGCRRCPSPTWAT